jgi:cell division septum initiation protein DivIVA
MCQQKIKELEQKISDLKKQLPAHSVPPSMILELEELEDEIASERSRQKDKRIGDA